MKILVCENNFEQMKRTLSWCESEKIAHKSVMTGKDCQSSVYKDKPDVLFLDVETKSHSAFEVLTYIKSNHLPIRVVLSASSVAISDLGLTPEKIHELGADALLLKPYTRDEFAKVFYLAVKPEPNPQAPAEDNTVTCPDDEMSELTSFPALLGSSLVMNYYLKTGPGIYNQVLKKGNTLAQHDIDVLTLGEEQSLYYRNTERMSFITYMNSLIEKHVSDSQWSSQTKVSTLRDVLESFYGQLKLEGMNDLIVFEGKRFCLNIVSMLEKDSRVRGNLRFLQADSGTIHEHNFLVALFTSMICRQVEWSSQRTTEYAVMAALFHDIGKTRLPEKIQNVHPSKLSSDENRLYERHPIIGADIAREFHLPEPVAQTILQHHETINGKGYPYQLNNRRIYPLAKIVGLADFFADFMAENKLNALDALREFIPNRNLSDKFDPDAVRSLIKCFIKGK